MSQEHFAALNAQLKNGNGKDRRVITPAYIKAAQLKRCARGAHDYSLIGEDDRYTVVVNEDGEFASITVKNPLAGSNDSNPIINTVQNWVASPDKCNCPDSPCHEHGTPGAREWLKDMYVLQVTDAEGNVVEYRDVPIEQLGPCRHMRMAECYLAGSATLFKDQLAELVESAKNDRQKAACQYWLNAYNEAYEDAARTYARQQEKREKARAAAVADRSATWEAKKLQAAVVARRRKQIREALWLADKLEDDALSANFVKAALLRRKARKAEQLAERLTARLDA